jgi:hypothetical protein
LTVLDECRSYTDLKWTQPLHIIITQCNITTG